MSQLATNEVIRQAQNAKKI